MKSQFDLDNSYAYMIYRTARALRRQFIRISSEQGYDLYPEQWFVLVRIHNSPGCSQIDLAKDFEDRPSMTRGLRTMEQKKWIVIHKDPEDGRKNRIFLTELGQELFSSMAKAVSKERNRMFLSFNENDHKRFREIIDTIFERAME